MRPSITAWRFTGTRRPHPRREALQRKTAALKERLTPAAKRASLQSNWRLIMNSRAPGVRITAVFAFVLSLLPGLAFAAIAITNVEIFEPNTTTPVGTKLPGSLVDIRVSATLSGGTDADWNATNITLTKIGETDHEIVCANIPDIDNSDGNFLVTIQDVVLPSDIVGTWTVRIRAFDNTGQCDEAVGSDDTEDTSASITLEYPALPGGVELDLVLCLDGSGSISSGDWTLQLNGTSAGLEFALSPDHLDSTVRVTTIVFAANIFVGPGPTVINSQGTLDTYSDDIDNLSQPGGLTNTSGCISAALAVLCGDADCPDDGVKRVIDVSTDGNPTESNCGGNAPDLPIFDEDEECAIFRADEAETAGVDVLNAIGVGSGIGQDNLEAWVFPPPVEVFDTSLNEFPVPGDEGFVILVEEFADYEPAIVAKLGAELTEAAFIVNKTYDDDNETAVLITLTCTGDTIIADDTLDAAPGAPAEFDVSGFDVDDTCTATESGVPAGYTTDNTDCVEVNIEDPGECTIANTLNTGGFTVNKDFSDDNTATVSVTATCSSGTVTNNPQLASEAAPAVFTVEGFEPGATCTATEGTAPTGYTSDETDCQDQDPIDGSCTITNTQDSVTFTVNKDFDDDNTASVDVSLSCTDVDPADITVNDGTASEASPAGFTVSNFPFGGTTCTATEVEPAGYTAVSTTCQDDIGLATNGECTITNQQDPVTFTVNKDFDDDNTAAVSVSLSCTDVDPADITVNDGSASEASPASFTVNDFPFGGTTCTATEVEPAGYTAVSTTCQDDIGLATDGECTITNVANTGTFTVRKIWTDDSQGDVSVTATCTAPAIVLNNPQLAGGSGSAIFNVSRVTESTTCTATEAVPQGYEADISDCQDGDPINGGCAITNTPTAVDRATFRVTKDFTDDNTAGVEVLISCNTGLPLDQSKVITEATHVEFVVGDFDPGEMDCDVFEVVPNGYSPTYTAGFDTEGDAIITDDAEGCHFDDVVGGDFTCHIVNTPDPVDVVIIKDWVFEGSSVASGIDTRYELTLFCNGEIIYGVEIGLNQEAPSGENGSFCGIFALEGQQGNNSFPTWCKAFSGDGPDTFLAEVIPEFPSSHCFVLERLFDDAVEVDNGCLDITVSAGNGASCTITNTVFFEGIPTLNQYGLALLALLMLGVGFVGFRRFA
jgi:hypothetical protein